MGLLYYLTQVIVLLEVEQEWTLVVGWDCLKNYWLGRLVVWTADLVDLELLVYCLSSTFFLTAVGISRALLTNLSYSKLRRALLS